jgi:hypothetical protein
MNFLTLNSKFDKGMFAPHSTSGYRASASNPMLSQEHIRAQIYIELSVSVPDHY